ncbi:MAG: hypothetical protein JNL01_09370 [Bdellovibrionales bacterium]|nr:hypothetical protein [Bdellovibrionales bacterium]
MKNLLIALTLVLSFCFTTSAVEAKGRRAFRASCKTACSVQKGAKKRECVRHCMARLKSR